MDVVLVAAKKDIINDYLVIAVAVVLGAPAPVSAARGKTTSSVKLYPAADSPLPHATGTVTLLYPDNAGIYYRVLRVSVSKLAPNASYYMPVTVVNRWTGWTSVVNVWIQTDAHGKGEVGWARPDYHITSRSFQVYDASGTVVLTSNP